MNKDDKNILISIITVCFNSQKTITDTLNSLLNQTNNNFECIIVDGGSKDHTITIIKEFELKFQEKGISYKWSSEPDKGLYDAMNKGIKKSTGELIAFLNSDDWYEVDALQYIVSNYDKKIGLIHGNIILCKTDKKIIKTLKPPLKEKSYLYGNPFFHPACFFKNEEVKKLKEYYNLDFKIAADYDFIVRLIKNKVNIKYIDKNISYFRDGGVSSINIIDALYESHKVRVHNGVNSILSFSIFIYVTLKNRVSILLNKFNKK